MAETVSKPKQPRSEVPRIIREILLFPFILVGIILQLIFGAVVESFDDPQFRTLMGALTVGAVFVVVALFFLAPG